MRILLDECLPIDFRHSFAGHQAHSAEWAGFKGQKNGELLRALPRDGNGTNQRRARRRVAELGVSLAAYIRRLMAWTMRGTWARLTPTRTSEYGSDQFAIRSERAACVHRTALSTAARFYSTSPFQDQRGMCRPSGTSSGERW